MAGMAGDAYCLNEMTFAGFEQEDVQSEMDRIKKTADDCLKRSCGFANAVDGVIYIGRE